MTRHFPSVRGGVAVVLALAAGFFVPALFSGKSGHTAYSRPLTAGGWALALCLLIAPVLAAFVAWHRRPVPDRVCAVASLLSTLWMIYVFIDEVS